MSHHQFIQDCNQIVQQLESLEAVLTDLIQSSQRIKGLPEIKSMRRGLKI